MEMSLIFREYPISAAGWHVRLRVKTHEQAVGRQLIAVSQTKAEVKRQAGGANRIMCAVYNFNGNVTDMPSAFPIFPF